MRIFVGFYPDERLLNEFRNIKNKLSNYERNLKFTPKDQIHLTIKFLGGDIDFDNFQAYWETFKNYHSETKKFSYQIENVEFGFHHQVVPKILLAHVEGNDSLRDLTVSASDIAKELRLPDIITRKEQKKLVHHFTLARVKSNASKSFGRDLKEYLRLNITKPEGEFTVDKISAIESKLSPTGPVYKTIDTIDLK